MIADLIPNTHARSHTLLDAFISEEKDGKKVQNNAFKDVEMNKAGDKQVNERMVEISNQKEAEP